MAAGAAAGPGPAALPAFFEWQAPEDWRMVDFISDLHLAEAMPRTFEAWAAHLRHTPADAVVILGDLFEGWVGDDVRERPFERRCMEVMAEAASHRTLAFMVGNRDFLFGTAAVRAAGMMALADPTVLDAWGRRLLLSHGDALCLDDVPYQAFRRQVRSTAWQQAFLARPLAERLQVAAEAVHWLHAMGAAELIHGHTHRPGSAALAPGYKRHVLSDWDLDGADRAEVLRLTRGGLQRVAPERGR